MQLHSALSDHPHGQPFFPTLPGRHRIGSAWSGHRPAVAEPRSSIRRIHAALAVCLVWAWCVPGLPANDKLRIGDKAPEWTDLKGIDDQPHSLKDWHDKQVLVVCFTCNSCPYSVDYEDRLIALSRKYADHPAGVAVIAINANRKPSETLEKMKERAAAKEFPFPCLIDETQQVAGDWGAVFTPEFFVLNKEREVIYMGAMDDKTDASQVTVNYVEQAIEAALKGDRPKTTEVPARGCAIPFKRTRK